MHRFLRRFSIFFFGSYTSRAIWRSCFIEGKFKKKKRYKAEIYVKTIFPSKSYSFFYFIIFPNTPLYILQEGIMSNGIFCVYKACEFTIADLQILLRTRYCGTEICHRDVVTKGHLRFVPILLRLYTADK